MKRSSLLLLIAFMVAWSGRQNIEAEEKPRPTNSERVPILLNKPERLNTPRWPVTFGVPFKPGDCRDVGALGIVDESGATVPSQFVKTAEAADGSVRWALGDFTADFAKRYFLTLNAKAGSQRDDAGPVKDEIQIQTTGDGRIAVETGGARYEFRKDSPGLMAIALDANRDGKFAADETLVSGDAGGFTVISSTGSAGLLRCKKLRVEQPGKRHTVVALEGDYADAKGARLAAALVYFHFYAGSSQVRVSHKFIVTEDSNQMWFKDIGLTLRTSLGEAATATFNNDHDKSQVAFSHPLSGSRLTMLQDEFPHFGSAKSHFAIAEDRDGRKKQLSSGSACGDWADVSSSRWGLAAQVPGFAEQFPKALQASTNELTIKLWAAESGKELNYRTPQIIKDYFGHDWISADDPCVKAPNIAQGTSKIHELWLYPHAGPLTKEITSGFGATREEIFAVPPNVAAVEYFASRPINLFDPAGKPVASEDLGKARYRFQTGGQSGSWALEAGRDKFLGEHSDGAESFVKIAKPEFPLTIALGDPKRLFKVAASVPAHASPAPGIASDQPFGDSLKGFGQAIRLNNQFVQVAAADAPAPRERGTVEFLMKPLWSATDCHMNTMSDSTVRLALFRADPITAGYNIDPDNLGRTGRYNTGQFVLGVQRAGTSRAGVFFEAGKWYHIALTWDVNGTNSECDIFINGRKKAYNHYVEGMAKGAPVSKLLPPGTDIRFGSGRVSGKIPTGEFYDELRVSCTVRYRNDFTVSTAPFEPDADTYLLMHLDGNLDGVQNGKPITGKLTRGKM